MLANDTDLDGDALAVSSATDGAFGTTTVNPDGTITYTPDADDSGPDSFTYTITDGNGESDTATVSVTVNAVDDAPVALDEFADVDEDDASGPVLSGQLDASDVDNVDADITYALNTGTPAGFSLDTDGSWDFDTSANAYQDLAEGDTQVVTAGYTATSNGKTDNGTITITVTGTNDAPVAQVATSTTDEDNSVSGSVVATDVDGDALSYALASGPASGSVSMNPDGTYTYDPSGAFENLDTGDTATDTFTYTVTDSEGVADTQTVTVTINGVNDAPVALDESNTATESDTPSRDRHARRDRCRE